MLDHFTEVTRGFGGAVKPLSGSLVYSLEDFRPGLQALLEGSPGQLAKLLVAQVKRATGEKDENKLTALAARVAALLARRHNDGDPRIETEPLAMARFLGPAMRRQGGETMGNDIKQWIEIDPLDTLFFRGSEPMVAGQNHEVRSVFPPMPSTILGALRTAILAQRGVSLAAFLQHEESSPVVQSLPLLGSAEKSGFAVAGPLIEAEIAGGARETFLPSPAHWFGGQRWGRDPGD